jgi:hypothetical protein
VSASARFPSRFFLHPCHEYFLLVFPLAAVAEEVLPRLVATLVNWSYKGAC